MIETAPPYWTERLRGGWALFWKPAFVGTCLSLSVGMAVAQTAEVSQFGQAEGWLVVRRSDGCFVTQSYDGPGETSLTVFYNAEDADGPVSLLISNANWTVAEGRGEGYVLDFRGNGAERWSGLRVNTFRSDGRGVLTINFAADASAEILADLTVANSLHIFRNSQVIDRLNLAGSAAGVRLLMRCVQAFPHRGIPRNPFENDRED